MAHEIFHIQTIRTSNPYTKKAYIAFNMDAGLPLSSMSQSPIILAAFKVKKEK